jgi:hypothetical protein
LNQTCLLHLVGNSALENEMLQQSGKFSIELQPEDTSLQFALTLVFIIVTKINVIGRNSFADSIKNAVQSSI